MNAPGIASLVAMLALPLPVELAAQQNMLIAVGDRVRVSAPEAVSGRCTGTITALSSDTLVVRSEDRSWRFPLTSISGLEISRGTKDLTGVGALVGLAASATTGAFLGYSSGSESCRVSLCLEKNENAVATAVVFGLATASLGAFVGSLIEVDRWEGIPLQNLRIQPSPVAPDGVSLAVSMPWPSRR